MRKRGPGAGSRTCGPPRARITRTRDQVTRYHMQDILARIDRALDTEP